MYSNCSYELILLDGCERIESFVSPAVVLSKCFDGFKNTLNVFSRIGTGFEVTVFVFFYKVFDGDFAISDFSTKLS